MKVLNQTLKIHSPKVIKQNEIPNSILSWGDKSMILDIQNLPSNISRLLPVGFLVENNPLKWEGFISACLAKGYLK